MIGCAAPESTSRRRSETASSEAMLVLIRETLVAGPGYGFPTTRMLAHAEGAVDDWRSGNDWVEYEMRLNEVLPSYRDPVICTYDVNLLTAPLAIDILRTHPVAIIGGVLIENCFFTRPDDFIREVRSRAGPSMPYRG